VFSGVFAAEEMDGIGDKVSEDTTVDIQMLLEVLLNMSLRCACLIGKAFFWQKAKLAVLELLSSSCQIIRISEACWIKKILL
jgi:hypothetical protein